MKPKHIALTAIAGAYLALGMGMLGCANKPAPATPSAAYVAANAARLQVTKARMAIERMEQKSPAVALEARQSEDALAKADAAIQENQAALETMQTQAAELANAKAHAEKSRDFWRGTAWKLALLSLALGIWTLRKPLLALCGVPTL